MKKLNYLFAVLTAVAFFSSCEDETIKEVEVNKDVQRISFEYVELNENGYQNNFPEGLILSDVGFYNHYEEEAYIYWEGFSVSDNTDKTTTGYENQYSVYANSGANNSEKFAVAFAGFYETTNLKFPGTQEYTFKSMMINNSTYAALYMKEGDTKYEAGKWFKLIITGFDGEGNEKGKVEYYLADFTNGKSFICSDWTSLNLSSLGKVNKLEFSFDSNDTGDYGINTPQYVCVDDIIYYVD
jgi:hypothetical protein